MLAYPFLKVRLIDAAGLFQVIPSGEHSIIKESGLLLNKNTLTEFTSVAL